MRYVRGRRSDHRGGRAHRSHREEWRSTGFSHGLIAGRDPASPVQSRPANQRASVIRTTGFSMRIRQYLTCSFIVVASLTGCTDNLSPHTAPVTPTVGMDRASVTGRVLDPQGAPVAGATVTVRTLDEHATS